MDVSGAAPPVLREPPHVTSMLQGFVRFQEVLVPVLVAINPLTVLPFFFATTQSMTPAASERLARKATSTAFSVAVVITLAGQVMFRMLGITVNDLRVGGGLILLVLAIYDIILSREQFNRQEVGDLGVVPLGVPLIVGPATMTACLVLADTHGRAAVVVSLLLNIGLTWLLLHHAHRLRRIFNDAVIRAVGKVMSLLLAAIAVATMRAGIVGFLGR